MDCQIGTHYLFSVSVLNLSNILSLIFRMLIMFMHCLALFINGYIDLVIFM